MPAVQEFAFAFGVPEVVYEGVRRPSPGAPYEPYRRVVPARTCRRIGRGRTEDAARADAWKRVTAPAGTVPTSAELVPLDDRYRLPCQMGPEQRAAFAAKIMADVNGRLHRLAVAHENLMRAGGWPDR